MHVSWDIIMYLPVAMVLPVGSSSCLGLNVVCTQCRGQLPLGLPTCSHVVGILKWEAGKTAIIIIMSQ